MWTDKPGEAGTPVAVDDDGAEVVAETVRLNFADNLTVTDNGAGAVTIDGQPGPPPPVAYQATPTVETLRDALISLGLMDPAP